jgi:hypothetical protein
MPLRRRKVKLSLLNHLRRAGLQSLTPTGSTGFIDLRLEDLSLQGRAFDN